MSKKCLENGPSVPSAWRTWRLMISASILVPVATRYLSSNSNVQLIISSYLAQICRFCWNRILTVGNGLCPACRREFSDTPAAFQPVSTEELSFVKVRSFNLPPPPPTSLTVFLYRKARRKHKEQSRKLNRVESVRQNIANPDTRVVQTNLVFVTGLPLRLADADILKRPDYFGKFGKIHRVIIKQGIVTSYLASRQQVRSHLDILVN